LRLIAAAVLGLLLLAHPAPPGPTEQQALPQILARLEEISSSDPDASIRLCREGLALPGLSTSPGVELRLRRLLAEAMTAKGDSPEARESAQRWLEAATTQKDPGEIAAATIHLGWLDLRGGKYDLALERFLGALGWNGIDARPAIKANAVHGVGRVHGSRGDTNLAIENLGRARDMFLSLGDKSSLGEVTSAIGVVHGQAGNLDAARRAFEEARDIFEALGERRKLVVVLGNLAVVRDNLGDTAGAFRDFQTTLELARQVGTPSDIALGELNVGDMLIKLGRAPAAVVHLQEALRRAKGENAKEIQSWCHEALSMAYERMDSPGLALAHYKQFKALRDGLLNEQSEARIAELQTRYESVTRDKENQRLRSENELQQANLERQRTIQYALAGGSLLLLFGLAALVSRHRTLRAANRALAERSEEISRQKGELEGWRARLEERVQQRTLELSRLNEELRKEIEHRVQAERENEDLQARYLQAQKMEAVGLLAGGVAHDFNNILTGIGMTSELALSKAEPSSPSARAHRNVLDLARRAGRLTQQLLAFSRQQVLRPRIVHVHELIRSSLSMLGQILGEDIEVRFEAGAEEDSVAADPTQIEQVLVNLAVNARDAMPKGGLLLVETELETVTGGASMGEELPAPGPHVAIRITDQGVGMDPDTLEHIFEPFFTTKEIGKGTGLGLATTYGIVRQHRGIIRVASEPGRGTTFTVLLPLTREHSAATPAPPTSEAHRPRLECRGAILVLEDNDSIRDLVAEVLKLEGLEVLSARAALDAASLLGDHGSRIELLISDVILPGMSGPEFYETQVRPHFPDMAVLFISGFADHHVFQTEVSDRRRALLEKPFTHTQLIQAVEAALASQP
jgi:signal transduction histidine kinase/CheY-like chemotaxis protein